MVNAADDVVATFVTSKTTQNAVFFSDTITDGDTFTVYTGGNASGDSTGG